LLGHCFAVYLRAHLVELFLPSAILTSLLMASLVWYFGSKNGVLGASMVYMVVHTFISLPMAFLIWRKARLNWGYNKY
jgi:ABC-type Fe3+-siderophore transport system permease subunit